MLWGQPPHSVVTSHSNLPGGTGDNSISSRFLAPFPAAAAVLLTVGEAMTPQGLDKPVTTAARASREIQIAATHSGQLYLSDGLVILGLGALGVSFMAIATLALSSRAATAASASLIGGFGAVCGVVVNVLVGYDVAAVAAAHTTPAAADSVLVSANTSAAFVVFIVGYIGGVLVATILSWVNLWRNKTLPRWLAVLFVAGLVIAASSPPGIVAVPLSLPFVFAASILSAKIWQVQASLPQLQPDPVAWPR
jgi:hypothetical protein